MKSSYPGWRDTVQFAHRVLDEVAEKDALQDERLSFNATSRVVEEIGERYGRWQEKECHDLKAALLKLERPGTGRVPLKDFYGDSLDGGWQFTESISYLRDHGILDESDPQDKSVIVVNYID